MLSSKTEDKLNRKQKQLSKKQKGSNNRKKARIEVAKTHRKIREQRLDFQHKLSRYLVNNYDTIAVENLQIQNMMKNHCLAKSIQDASWSQFLQLLSYKAEEAGKLVIKVNPRNTSKTCNICNFVNKELLLKDREWICPNCGTVHDRDINASVNILNKSTVRTTGIQACGGLEMLNPLRQEMPVIRA